MTLPLRFKLKHSYNLNHHGRARLHVLNNNIFQILNKIRILMNENIIPKINEIRITNNSDYKFSYLNLVCYFRMLKLGSRTKSLFLISIKEMLLRKKSLNSRKGQINRVGEAKQNFEIYHQFYEVLKTWTNNLLTKQKINSGIS